MKISLLHRDGVHQPSTLKHLKSNFDVTVIELREDYLDRLVESDADVIMLDFLSDGMVREDDDILVKGIRSVSRTPLFLVLTEHAGASYREKMFDSGVDGCIQAPFMKEELFARLSILGKKSSLLFTGTTIHARGVYMNLTSHNVSYEGKTLSLTKTEYGILFHLLLNKCSVVRTRELDLYIQNGKSSHSSAVNVHILNIRKKLGSGNVIRTVPHHGFLVS